ncbi:MAG: SMC-Scp complex subunit ScpB [Candidatus Lokiarchaeota archaeon]|nr:SMC-Scp complex subunit ScpB [Candidatus Harpocratesius repetitus]
MSEKEENKNEDKEISEKSEEKSSEIQNTNQNASLNDNQKPESNNNLEVSLDNDNEFDDEILSDLEELDESLDLPTEKEDNEEIVEEEEKLDTIDENVQLEKDEKVGEEIDTEEKIGEEIDTEERIGEKIDTEERIGEKIEGEDDAFLDESKIAPMSDEEEAHIHLKNVVEGALFVAGRPVSLEELNVKTDIKKRDLEALLDELAMDYLMRSTALEIIRIQDKYSLQIKPEYTPRVKKFASGGLIPDAILKTLTIIALKQPLMKSTLVKLRGSTAYEHVKFLIDRGYIEARKKGRSSELCTTDQFADTFGLSRDIETQKKQLIAQLGVQDGK